jgi:hypothetical protein
VDIIDAILAGEKPAKNLHDGAGKLGGSKGGKLGAEN